MDIALEAKAKAKRQRGRPLLPDAERRTITVSSRMTPGELREIDARRGIMQRGEWLRAAAFSALPPSPPPVISLDALRILSRVAGNLSTVAGAMRGGEYVEIEECRAAVAALRAALTGALPPGPR